MTKNEIIIPELNKETIESMVYVIRGQKVMLDFELARIYGYETKTFNQQVKNNILKFDDDFRFQLTKEEWNKILMSQNATSRWGGYRKLPYAFTEQGIYMLMTVLKGDLAVKQSKASIKNEIIIPELKKETIELMIYEIRGQKVMLDFELARIYGYETKNFNRQVKNNKDKFPDEFRFQLTKEELENLVRCKNFTSRSWEHSNEGGRRYLPYAFTEQGIYMLMTVLKGDIATRQSIALVKAFKNMKDYIIENKNILYIGTSKYIEDKFASYDKRFEKVEEKLKIVMDNFIDPTTYKHYLILNGEKIEADIAYQNIFRLAKQTIYIIDDYIDIKTLQLLKVVKNVNIIIFSDNKARNNLNSNFVNDFINDTGLNLLFKQNNDMFHDRYIVIDFNTSNESIYHCGASSKDAGNRITTIVKIEEKELYKSLIQDILNNQRLEIK